MFPFQASFPHPPNQIQNDGNNGLAPAQQVMLSNPCFTNPSNMGGNPLIQSHLNGFNLQHPVGFNGINPNLNNLNANFAALANTHFLNPSMQNIQMGRPFMGSIPQGLNQPYGQFCPQNTFQQLNAAVVSQQYGQLHNFPQNFNQIAPMQQNGQLFLHNRPQVTNQNGHPQVCGNMLGGHPQVCGNMLGGQFNSHNQPQHMNQVTGFPQNNQFSQNPAHSSQVIPNGVHPGSNLSIGSSNQGAQTIGSQNPNFPMNQQLGLMSSNSQNNSQGQNLSIPTTMGQNASRPSGPVQMQQTQNHLQPANHQRSQGDHSKDGGSNISNMSPGNHHNQNFSRNHHEPGKRDSANPRFQNNKSQPWANAKGNFRAFNGKAVKAGTEQHTGGARKSHQANSTKHEKVERRSLPLNYTEEEILQWRNERKKNHPSRPKNEKLAENENPSEATKRRRQQLKDILAKQAELGVEVAELPPNYLSETEKQVCEKEDERKTWGKKGKFQNNYGKKRRGKHGNANRFAKQQKLGENDSFTPALNKRKNPTLLQKLLSADIKRDKSHILQAFKFMVMNSFFKEYPAKPLEFPLVTVKDGDGSKSKVLEEKSSCQNGTGISAVVDEDDIVEEVEGSKDHDDDDDDENEDGVEDIKKSEGEEGEITD